MTYSELDVIEKHKLQIDLKRYMSYGWSLRIIRGLVRMRYGVSVNTGEIKALIKGL